VRHWLFVVLLFSQNLVADDQQDIMAQYQPVFSQFSQQLISEQAVFKRDPDRYWSWVDALLVPLWSRQASIKQLANPKHLEVLTNEQTIQFNAVLDRTMQRYAFEILDSYSGQRFEIQKIEFDKDDPRFATLVVTAIWDNFPDLDIDLMLVNENDTWRFYNIRYGWFSYIGTKKWAYRRGLSASNFAAFMDKLDAKNRRHFQSMCQHVERQKSELCRGWMQRIATM